MKTEDNPAENGRLISKPLVDCVVWSVQDTRICSVAKGERSYHVFFQLLQACKHSSRETDRKYTYTVSCYIYMCISVIFILYARQYKSCEYTYIYMYNAHIVTYIS